MRGRIPRIHFAKRTGEGLSPATRERGGVIGSKNALHRRETGYNFRMQLATFAIRALEAMFFVGLVGSTVVVIISFVEDAKELFGDE